MKNGIVVALLMMAWLIVMALTGCSTEADRVSYNLSQQADNFNDIRQVTVIKLPARRCPVPDDGQNEHHGGYRG